MDPNPYYLIIATAAIVLSAFVVALAFYVTYSVKQNMAAESQKLHLLQEQEKLEYRLQEAKRMVMIGSLAGGMAYFLNHTMFEIKDLLRLMNMESGMRGKVEKLIDNEIQQAIKVSDQLQQIAHPEQIHSIPMSAINLIASVKDEIISLLPNTIKFSTDCHQNYDLIQGDQSLLQQALLNLVTNATDAMPEGGILSISLSNTNGQNSEDNYLVLSVFDTGYGMDEETKSKVFEPFFTKKRRFDRLGLGLSFVYGILQIHKGHLEITSELNQGTTVSLFLPVASQQDIIDHANKKEQGELIPNGSKSTLTREDLMLLAQGVMGKA